MPRRNGQVIEEPIIDPPPSTSYATRARRPRYNWFRELFHIGAGEFVRADVATIPTSCARCAQVHGDPDKVDLMVGMYAGEAAGGIGFSDTAFRVSILGVGVAAVSDRFYTAGLHGRSLYPARSRLGQATTT